MNLIEFSSFQTFILVHGIPDPFLTYVTISFFLRRRLPLLLRNNKCNKKNYVCMKKLAVSNAFQFLESGEKSNRIHPHKIWTPEGSWHQKGKLGFLIRISLKAQQNIQFFAPMYVYFRLKRRRDCIWYRYFESFLLIVTGLTSVSTGQQSDDCGRGRWCAYHPRAFFIGETTSTSWK